MLSITSDGAKNWALGFWLLWFGGGGVAKMLLLVLRKKKLDFNDTSIVVVGIIMYAMYLWLSCPQL